MASPFPSHSSPEGTCHPFSCYLSSTYQPLGSSQNDAFKINQSVLAQKPPHPSPQAQRQGPNNGSSTLGAPAWACPQPCPLPPSATLPAILGGVTSHLHSCLKIPFQNSKLYVTYILPPISKIPLLCEACPTTPFSLCLCGHLQSFHIQCALLPQFTFVSPVTNRAAPGGPASFCSPLWPQHLGHSYTVNTC